MSGIVPSDLGAGTLAPLRSVNYRHNEGPHWELASYFAGMNLGAFAVVLRNQKASVDGLGLQYGFRAILETDRVTVYRKGRQVPGMRVNEGDWSG